jgi:DNA-binding transcriptional MerR regulator
LIGGLTVNENCYKIEDVAKKTDLTKRAIRYYEEFGIIKPERNQCGYRVYHEKDIKKLIRVRDLRLKVGFTISEIKDYFELESNIHNALELDNSSNGNKVDIEKYISDINSQIQVINSKEIALEKVKEKYNKTLEKLIRLK